MEDLAARYANRAVRSIFIYTREAHPGENLPPLSSMEDKRDHAGQFRAEANINRQILLDDMAGTAHHAYGLLPNMTWIVGRGGFIHYKASWTAVEDIEEALGNALTYQENRVAKQLVPFFSERAASYERDQERLRVGLIRAGQQAVDDMARAMKNNKTAKPKSPEIAPGGTGNYYQPGEDD
jgi:hypothetical protein